MATAQPLPLRRVLLVDDDPSVHVLVTHALVSRTASLLACHGRPLPVACPDSLPKMRKTPAPLGQTGSLNSDEPKFWVSSFVWVHSVL